jgi:hypothetical protein
MTLLPISPKSSRLIYGSRDGGRSVHSDLVPWFDRAMREAAQYLHLSEHSVAGKKVWSAGDVEGHEAESESNPQQKQYFLLDLARTFPPGTQPRMAPLVCGPMTDICVGAESPMDTPHLPFSERAVFARQLRPEMLQFLKSQGLPPLSSDALTRW